MDDVVALSKLRYTDSKKRVHVLDRRYYKLFCTSGLLIPDKVRHIFMQAGILSGSLGKKKEENRQEFLESIQQNIVFLNKYKN